MADTAEPSPVQVPLADIDLDDETFRFRVRLDVGALAKDIELHGQHFPVVLRRLEGKEQFQLVCGFRRATAMKSLGRTMVRSVIRELDDDAALRIAWAENEQRESYGDLDRAHAILKCHEAGWTMKRLGEIFGLQRKQLSRLKRVARLPPVVHEAVADGRIRTTHAIVLSEMLSKYADLRLAAWIEQIAVHGMSVRELRKRIARLYRPAKADRSLISRDATSGAIQFHVRRLEPTKMTEDERQRAIGALERAIEALREG